MADNYGSRYFDFFGLSRELRDAIYDNLLSDSTLLRTGDDLSGFSFLAKGTVDTNFLLVNRPFHDELKERAEKTLHVTIQDHGDDLSDLYEAKFPPLLLRVRSLTLQLWLGCHDGDLTASGSECHILKLDLESLYEVVEVMVRSTPRSERLRIDLHRPDHCHHAICQNTVAKGLKSFFPTTQAVELWIFRIPLMKLFTVQEPSASSSYLMNPGHWRYEDRKGPFAKWNHATQALEDIDCGSKKHATAGSEG
ncbi:hypothetical protein KC340_g17492 [Hortaea werneckii]|nr:hypothetical protein KC342_g17747 [Hortaea werneckii]KAI7057458.1 hypothetical protein KC339_g17925 [Hortaea werneckii]KAI7234112.1 hypothetical protein KC365_g6095 [Hortaea werneckii]KAI7290142.1 hypothetical protein KC340_g17492 [Hortaea werneckii]KAI7374606.1 hypothetical protein KC328_g15915 [Hortaea werneckii]